MNISLMRLKPVVKELRSIRDQLERIADCFEAELAEKKIYLRPPKTDTRGPEPTLAYTDEELDYVYESFDRYRREDQLKSKEEE